MSSPVPCPSPVRAGRLLSVVVIDEHPIVSLGVTALVDGSRDMAIAGSATTAQAGVELVRRERPDVALVDVRLPDMAAGEVVPELRAVAPQTHVVVFAAYEDHAAVAGAVAAGADGCLFKDGPIGEVLSTIRAVMGGRRVIDGRLLADLPGAPRRPASTCGLTEREYEVLRLVALGKSNPEIAAALGLTRNTIKTYLRTAMSKLRARNRVEAVVRAQQERIL